MLIALLVLAGLVDAGSPGAASTLHEDGDLFGFSLARIGDLDGDGKAELAIGCPLITGEKDEIGRVYVINPSSGMVVLALRGSWDHDRFGNNLACAGDLDGDGNDDLLVQSQDHSRTIFTHSISSRTGKELHASVAGRVISPDFGGQRDLTVIGDVTGDGILDYAQLHGIDPDWAHPRLRVQVVSGGDGTTVRELGPETGAPYNEIALAGDLDGDGLSEIAVGCWYRDDAIEIWSPKRAQLVRVLRPKGAAQTSRITLAGGRDFDGDGIPDLVAGFVEVLKLGRIVVYSGKDGGAIRGWRDRTNPEMDFARTLELLDDLQGDGVPEILVGAPGSISVGSWMGVLDGASDRVLHHDGCDEWKCSHFGVSACGLGDLDGDGVTDFAVGEASWKGRGDDPGRVCVYSGKTGARLHEWRREDLSSAR